MKNQLASLLASGSVEHVSRTDNPHHVTSIQVLPTQAGQSGKYLKTDGATASWAPAGGGGGNSIYIEEGGAAEGDSSAADLTLDFADADFNITTAAGTCSLVINDLGIDHDATTNFVAAEHFLQTAITNVSTALATGLLKVTTGTGALSAAAAGVDFAAAAHSHLAADIGSGAAPIGHVLTADGAGNSGWAAVTGGSGLTHPQVMSRTALGF